MKRRKPSAASGSGAAFLRAAFATEQAVLRAKLESSKRIAHAGDSGEVNEQFFIDLLRAYLPDRYTVDKAMVLDSTGAVSESIDVVVFDRQYSPTLLDSKKHRYVPAEAVYAVFECKPEISRATLRYAGKKVASVRRLHRTSVEIHEARGPTPPKEPFKIVGGILASRVGWKSGLNERFEAAHGELKDDHSIECGFAASGACFDVTSNGYLYGPGDNALAAFAFYLLSRLQRLGTAPAVDWSAYAERLKGPQGEH